MPVTKPLRSTEKPVQMCASEILALALGSNYHYHLIERETEALTDFFFKVVAKDPQLQAVARSCGLGLELGSSLPL